MPRPKVGLNSAGVSELLKSHQMQALVKEAADEVARNVDEQGLVAHSPGKESPEEIHAKVETGISDRARATVAINHPAGEAMQAKDGVLTKAAGQAGLKVRGY